MFLMRVKIAAYQRIRKERRSNRPIWQSRFYDHILGTRNEFDDALNTFIRILCGEG
jgi:hypothetical protein